MPLQVYPYSLLWVGALAALLLGLWLRRPIWPALVCALALLGTGLAGLRARSAPDAVGLQPTALLLLCAAAILCLPLVQGGRRGAAARYALLLLGSFGAVLMAGAQAVTDLLLGAVIVATAGLALLTDDEGVARLIGHYALAAAALLALIYGSVLLYGAAGTTSLVALAAPATAGSEPLLRLGSALLVLGLSFWACLVPVQGWSARAAPAPAAAVGFIAVVAKLAALLALLRVRPVLAAAGVDPVLVLGGLGVAVTTWGNVRALREQDLPALLRHIGTAHSGYLLLGVAAAQARDPAPLLFAFGAYAVAYLGAWSALAACRCRRHGEQRGLLGAQPAVAVALLLCLLSLAGLPPLAGFLGLFAVFSSAMAAGYGLLVILAVANLALALIYYLRLLLPIFLPTEVASDASTGAASAVRWVSIACAACALALGITLTLNLNELPWLAVVS